MYNLPETQDSEGLSPVVVGMDLRGERVRLVWGVPDGESAFYVFGWRLFKSRSRFERFWTRMESRLGEPRRLEAVVSGYSRDPLGILVWLRGQGVRLVQVLGTDLDVGSDLTLWGLPRTYRWAYDVALSGAYRTGAADRLHGLWIELQVAHRQVERITGDLRRLAAGSILEKACAKLEGGGEKSRS